MMGKSLPLLLLLLAPAAVAAENPASWQFMESVGGMKVGAPQPQEGGGWLLPLECDLTGLRRISTDPTILNSTQVIEQARWRIVDNQLQVTLLLKPSSYATDAARCTPLRLQGVKPGEYEAVYLDGAQRHPLGSFTLRR
jgi:hypothetical protein